MSEATTIRRELDRSGKIIYTNKGVSMLPLLREGRDAMIIEKPKGRLQKYDVPLYIRPDGAYVLHRILKVREWDYVIAGDNCISREYGITDDDIIGVMTAIVRNGKTIKTDNFWYKLYYHVWCDFFPIRAFILKVKFKLKNKFHRGDKNGK